MSKVSHSGHKGVEICVSWQPAKGGQVPPHAVEAASGCYVGRAKFEGNWIPAKVAQGHSCAYVPYGGQEHSIPEYEVLVCSDIGCYGKGFNWVKASNGEAPKNALVAGQLKDGAPLYIARGEVNGSMCVGKVHRAHNCAYFPWGGKEHKHADYDVLVLGN